MAEKPQKKNEQTKKDEKQPTEERQTLHVLTDGGIGKLAAKHGIDLVVVPPGNGISLDIQASNPNDTLAANAAATITALKDALKRETARADDEYKRVEVALLRATKAEREAREWQSLAGQMEKELNSPRDTPPTCADLPTSGWSSERALGLVRAVSVVDQPYLLGDLLELLAPHVGEAGANEGAADTLKRKLAERADYEERLQDADKKWERAVGDRDRITQDLAKLQVAMVSRRAPDADWLRVRDSISGFLREANMDVVSFGIVRCVEAMAREVESVRALLSPAPMVAVAVRDDSTKEISERYSVGVLEWDGKAVKFDLLEGPARPWADLVRTMNHAVATRLVPPTFR